MFDLCEREMLQQYFGGSINSVTARGRQRNNNLGGSYVQGKSGGMSPTRGDLHTLQTLTNLLKYHNLTFFTRIETTLGGLATPTPKPAKHSEPQGVF